MFPGGALFCKVSRELSAGQALLASLLPPPGSCCSPPLSLAQGSGQEEALYPAALHSDIQLLPQQAGMAAILATAVVNSEYRGTVAVPAAAAGCHCCSSTHLCPLLLSIRGHLSLQGLWDLVPQREEPAGPPPVLLR